MGLMSFHKTFTIKDEKRQSNHGLSFFASCSTEITAAFLKFGRANVKKPYSLKAGKAYDRTIPPILTKP